MVKRAKEHLSNNELFYWKLSPFDLLVTAIIGAHSGWPGVVGAALVFCAWRGILTLITGVREQL